MEEKSNGILLGEKKERQRFIYLANINFKKSISRQEGTKGDFAFALLSAIKAVSDCK